MASGHMAESILKSFLPPPTHNLKQSYIRKQVHECHWPNYGSPLRQHSCLVYKAVVTSLTSQGCDEDQKSVRKTGSTGSGWGRGVSVAIAQPVSKGQSEFLQHHDLTIKSCCPDVRQGIKFKSEKLSNKIKQLMDM